MRKVTGKQMKTVWRRDQFSAGDANLDSVWTISAPASDEKTFGKHPTQKPVTLIGRCLLASTKEGDLVLDPFLGGGTSAVACVTLKHKCVGLDLGVGVVRITDCL